jgi:glycosyltransferase involved in cell wall biosynthesis
VGADEKKITVVYEAAGAAFRPADAATIQAARQRYGIGSEYILFVGTIEPRKNIPFLLQAYARMKEMWQGSATMPQLVLAGKKGWLCESIFTVLNDLELGSSVVQTGGVPIDDLPALYSGACLFVMPSLYEGFGLPVLEAMSCGTPVVCSDVSSLPEVAGNAAMLVSPQDMVGLAAAMQHLCQDEALRGQMRVQGLERAAGFSWERAARETVAVYEAVASR